MEIRSYGPELEHKFCRLGDGVEVSDTAEITGYASVFGKCDQGGDVVRKGAYQRSLKGLGQRSVKMLWQHDPAQPIGIWEEVREDDLGLFVKGRILTDVQQGREALALIRAGAIDGLSIGYRTVKAEKDRQGRRVLSDLELWEVSLVTFPMLPDARVGAKAEQAEADALAGDLAEFFAEASRVLAGA
jgi:HK97 family phage prohead protease